MSDAEFEWDEAKAASNYAKHGVTFEAACEVFNDPFAVELMDNRQDYGEERFVLIGVVAGRVLTITYTMRDDTIRIISARGAEPFERRLYHEQGDR